MDTGFRRYDAGGEFEGYKFLGITGLWKVKNMRNTVINVVDNVAATVANGASVTGVLYLGGLRLFGIITPDTITGSVLTFQASADGVNYYNVYDADGNELSVQVGASRFVALDPILFAAAAFIKVRSGTSGTPVAQGQDTTLQLVLRGI